MVLVTSVEGINQMVNRQFLCRISSANTRTDLKLGVYDFTGKVYEVWSLWHVHLWQVIGNSQIERRGPCTFQDISISCKWSQVRRGSVVPMHTRAWKVFHLHNRISIQLETIIEPLGSEFQIRSSMDLESAVITWWPCPFCTLHLYLTSQMLAI
jgi:hypothetical protein